MYKYFVAVATRGTYEPLDSVAVGNCIIDSAGPITNTDELRALEARVEKESQEGFEEVVITSLELISDPGRSTPQFQKLWIEYCTEKARADMAEARVQHLVNFYTGITSSQSVSIDRLKTELAESDARILHQVGIINNKDVLIESLKKDIEDSAPEEGDEYPEHRYENPE